MDIEPGAIVVPITGNVYAAIDVTGAQVVLENDDEYFSLEIQDSSGNFDMGFVFSGVYQATAWLDSRIFYQSKVVTVSP
ncbi:MAG: hypothetical protein K8S56_02060, partial [Candidatus Cloacimonetes bacterium]|nr:hypothetical protein [Candidatus Cloacimonadota bacterium]